MERIVNYLGRCLAVLASLAIVVIVVAISMEVVVRNLTGASLPGMIEIAETGLVASVFLGLAYAGIKGEHVAVTLLTDRLGESGQRAVNLFVWALSSAFLLWITYASTRRAIDSTEIREERFGLMRWPVYPMRWIVVIGLLALTLVALLNLFRVVQRLAPLGAANEIEAILTAAPADHSASPASAPASSRDGGHYQPAPEEPVGVSIASPGLFHTRKDENNDH